VLNFYFFFFCFVLGTVIRFDCEGKQISVAQFFRKTYPTLQLKDLPCALVGSKEKPKMIPLEGLFVLPGQRPPGVLDARFRSLMTQHTSQEPVRCNDER
jgi:hypothetical protein